MGDDDDEMILVTRQGINLVTNKEVGQEAMPCCKLGHALLLEAMPC